jgi:hypothetical protein
VLIVLGVLLLMVISAASASLWVQALTTNTGGVR